MKPATLLPGFTRNVPLVASMPFVWEKYDPSLLTVPPAYLVFKHSRFLRSGSASPAGRRFSRLTDSANADMMGRLPRLLQHCRVKRYDNPFNLHRRRDSDRHHLRCHQSIFFPVAAGISDRHAAQPAVTDSDVITKN